MFTFKLALTGLDSDLLKNKSNWQNLFSKTQQMEIFFEQM